MVRLGCVLALVLLAGGCGNGGKLCGVQGNVSLAGTPLEQGTITFYPTSPESQVPAGGALIQDGKFAIAADQGLEPGKYKVTISAMEGASISPADYAAGKSPVAAPKEKVPAKYNSQSQLTVELKLGRANQVDFKLE